MTEEEIKAKRKQHYQENKEKILEYQKKRKQSMTKEQKAALREYHRSYYARKKAAEGKPYKPHKLKEDAPKPAKRKNPSRIKRYNMPSGIKLMKYPNDILVLSANTSLDFVPTEESLYQAKRELDKHLLNIKNEDRIVIVDSWNKLVTIEVYLKDEDCMQLIINELDDFLKNISKKLAS